LTDDRLVDVEGVRPASHSRFGIGFDHRDRVRLHELWDQVLDSERWTEGKLVWEPVLWSRWGRDWRADATGDSVASNATRALRGGEIVLLHDADHYGDPGCWRATAAALPRIIDLARGKGLTPVSLAPRTP
jgi:hypothetical protein